jgi:CRP/FNR family transcriptional regulator
MIDSQAGFIPHGSAKEGHIMNNTMWALIQKEIGKEFPSRLMRFSHEALSLEKFGIVTSLPKNTVFIEPGDIPKYCYLVKKGCIVGFEYTLNGDERIYNIMLPGSLVMEMNLILNEPSPIFFKATKPSILICIDRNTLLREMSDDFDVVINIVKSISFKLRATTEQIREIMCHETTWRLCNLLLIFAENYGIPYEDKTLIKEKLSQKILSNILGVNRITVNRIIKKLKDMDLIERINNYYCIYNKKRLKKYMDYLND